MNIIYAPSKNRGNGEIVNDLCICGYDIFVLNSIINSALKSINKNIELNIIYAPRNISKDFINSTFSSILDELNLNLNNLDSIDISSKIKITENIVISYEKIEQIDLKNCDIFISDFSSFALKFAFCNDTKAILLMPVFTNFIGEDDYFSLLNKTCKFAFSLKELNEILNENFKEPNITKQNKEILEFLNGDLI